MPKICQTAKANFSLPNAFENTRFELFVILKCQLATLVNKRRLDWMNILNREK